MYKIYQQAITEYILKETGGHHIDRRVAGICFGKSFDFTYPDGVTRETYQMKSLEQYPRHVIINIIKYVMVVYGITTTIKKMIVERISIESSSTSGYSSSTSGHSSSHEDNSSEDSSEDSSNSSENSSYDIIVINNNLDVIIGYHYGTSLRIVNIGGKFRLYKMDKKLRTHLLKMLLQPLKYIKSRSEDIAKHDDIREFFELWKANITRKIKEPQQIYIVLRAFSAEYMIVTDIINIIMRLYVEILRNELDIMKDND